ncbi:hypothetical protein BDE02_19G114800 [Populus trichocarpa]|nr:hypothetical protein BDE02_19G114800 [Populus trichocarpa]
MFTCIILHPASIMAYHPVVERVDSSCCFVQMGLINNLH